MFLSRLPEQSVEQTAELTVIRDPIALNVTSL